ncbi:MAG: RHS repeat-associated core domain-containing protein [Chromatiales bacterium]
MNHGMRRFISLLLTLLSLNAQAVEEVIHYHNDALGSPIAATDQDGRVVWRKSYAPYGQPIGQAAPNEPGYTGKLEEPELGIQNFGARWYDPRIGRFLAIDPAGFDPQNPQSFNRYAYANNNPYRFVDPDGNSPLDVGFFIADTVSLGLAVASRNPAAIQSAAFDFAASAVGLASPIPGTGLAIKAGRAGERVGDVANIPGKLYHYTSSKYADTIVENGLKPGISSKKVFTTPDGTKSGLQAQIDLALPPNRGVPDALLEIDTRTLNQMGVKVPGATPVGRDFNMPGGGQEVTFDTLIPPEAIRRVR